MANLPVPADVRPVPGQNNPSSLWNSQVRDGHTFLANRPLFVGTQINAQSIPNAAWTPVVIDSAQTDSYTGHSNSTNASRYVAQVPGWYAVSGIVCYTANATGVRAARLHVNGSVVQGSAQMNLTPTTADLCGIATPVRTVYLNVGDYVEVAAYQASGAALSTGFGSSPDLASGLWVRWTRT